MSVFNIQSGSDPPDLRSKEHDCVRRRFGLIAGAGRYPIVLAREIRKAGHEVICLGVPNHADPELASICNVFHWCGLARFGSACRFFKRHGVTEATMAGKIHKNLLLAPGFVWRQLPDLYTLRLFIPHFITRKKDCNNDTLLLTAVEAFERKGIHLLPGTDFAPEILMQREKITRRGPTLSQWKDICFGWNLSREMGRLDIGQSVAVKNQMTLAVEAIEGTDEMIRRAGTFSKKGGFAVLKIAKPLQDMRFDVPTFGLDTVRTMYESGANVLAIEAKKSIFIDKPEMIEFADRHGIVIVAIVEEDVATSESPFSETDEEISPVCSQTTPTN